MTTVMAMDARYMESAEPTSSPVQSRDSVISIFSWQYSAQLCARSTRRTRPMRRNRQAPIKAKYDPQTKKKLLGTKKETTSNASQAMTLGPQKPF